MSAGGRVDAEMLRERRSSGTDDEDDDSSDESGHHAPIMSIFASYYGIEDTSAQEMKGTIDDANFNSEQYVKDLLTNDSMEGLVMKDAEMIHDIRNLDGEMQKLVYDNYNKFITATETIKEMKNDVYGMDPDMDTVRTKMLQIGSTSKQLDEAMEEHRLQVDKLVRVRRLLERLEFLCELPEKLATLIEKEHYREAVQLYKKSITVLTSHSHVLSFKKIQERTETMMTAMTERVIALLNDPSLIAVKLTQHVNVLRLMNAPRHKVSTTLLSSHRNRALVLINSFKQTLQTSAHLEKSGSIDAPENTEQTVKALKIIGASREFHQIAMVGLLEAIKGILELYDNSQKEVPQSPAHGSHQEQAAIASPQECRAAYDQLVTTLNTIMESYMETMFTALKSFFSRFHHLLFSNPSTTQLSPVLEFALEAHDDDVIGGQRGIDREKFAVDMTYLHQLFMKLDMNKSTAAAAAVEEEEEDSAKMVNAFALQEERASWLLLMHQAVMDVSYLDSTLRECYHQLLDGHGEDRKVTSFTSIFAKKIIQLVTDHTKTMRNDLVASYVQHVSYEWLPKIKLLTHVARNATGEEQLQQPVMLPSVTAYSVSSAREVTQLHVTFMQSVHDVLLDRCVQTFTECCRYIKPVVDILEVLDTDGNGNQTSLLDELHLRDLPDYLLGSFFEEMTYMMQKKVKLVDNYRNRFVLSTAYTGHVALPSEEQDDVFITPWYNTTTAGSTGEVVDLSLALLFAALLRRLSNASTVQHLSEELNNHDLFPTYRPSDAYRQKCALHCLAASRQLVDFYLTENTQVLVHSFLGVVNNCYENGFGAVISSSSAPMKAVSSMTLSRDTLTIAKKLDSISAFVYLTFAESIPVLRVISDMARRSSLAMGGRQLAGGMSSNQSHMSLQMDIERLFSQKISVYPALHSYNNLYSKGTEREIILNSDLIIGTLLKSMLKAAQEAIRTMTLPSQSYLQIQADTTFIKQVASTLIKDATETDQLVDSILSGVFSRYQGANDIANASDGNEVKLINKAVAEGFASLADSTAVIVKPLGGR